MKILSWVSLEHLPEAKARTFLDDALEARGGIETVASGFGDEIGKTIAARRRWLMAQGLAMENGERLVIDRKRLALMEREAIAEEGGRLSKQLEKIFEQPVESERVAGIYRQFVVLPAGRFAVVEKSKEFTLVPWRDALEARAGMEISGVMRRGGVTWNFGKTRGGPAL